MIELFVCSSEWECTKEIIGGTVVVIVFLMYTFAFCQIAGPRKSMRIEPLDRFIFYLAYVQVLLEIVINLLYSSYIVGYLNNMLALFMEMLICSIFLLVSGTIAGLSQFKCILFLMLIYLLAIMGVAIYLSLITNHDEDVIECEGTIWIVLCGNNLFITLIVLIFALLSIRRRKISPEGRATISRALGTESIFHEARPKSGTNQIKDVVNKNTFIEDEDEEVIITSPFLKSEDQTRIDDSDDVKERSQNELFQDSSSIKLDHTTLSMTRPTLDMRKSQTMHIDKGELLFTKIDAANQDKLTSPDSPLEKFDLMSFQMLRKKNDLVILLICSVLSVTLSLIWELLVYMDIEKSSCYHFQHHTPLWLLGVYGILSAISKMIILIAIYYVIYWKARKNLRAFDYRSDIAIHERGGTISTKYGKISMVEKKQPQSLTFSGTRDLLLKDRQQSAANFTLREQEAFIKKSDGDRSSSHQFQGHDLVLSPDSHRHSASSASVAANVSKYVRTTLVKKKKSSINKRRGKERTQSFITESP